MCGGHVGHLCGQEGVHTVDQMLQIRTGQLFGLDRFLDSELGSIRLQVAAVQRAVQRAVVVAVVHLVAAAHGAVMGRAAVQMAAVERARCHRPLTAGATLRVPIHALQTAAQTAVVVALVAERAECRCVQWSLGYSRSNGLVNDRLEAQPQRVATIVR